MNFLPKDKEKRTHFLLVIAGTAGLLAAIGFGVIRQQYATLQKIAEQSTSAKEKFLKIKDTIKQADGTANDLANATYRLQKAEEDMASGDVYAWTYDTIRAFKASYHVDIPAIGQPAKGEVDMMAQFPFPQIKFNISGTAYFHDLGKFVSDFENTFPHMRIVNLTVEPGNVPGADAEKLSFRMDIIALVKSDS
jgi:hypothetical protein